MLSLSLLQFGLTILVTVSGASWALWQAMSSKIDKAFNLLKERVDKSDGKSDHFVSKDDYVRLTQELIARLDKMDQSRDRYVTREEYTEGQRRVEQLIVGLTAATTQSTATLTSRMDSLMFEIKKDR